MPLETLQPGDRDGIVAAVARDGGCIVDCLLDTQPVTL
jgi:hypothetical protein